MDKHYLLYFGSIFLWAEVDQPSDGIGNSMSPSSSFKTAITHDIARLRKADFKKDGKSVVWTISGNFRRVADTPIWLYQHGTHVNCSVAKYLNFKDMCAVTSHICDDLPKCTNPNHDRLEPFFHDNCGLKKVYTSLTSSQDVERKAYAERQLRKVTQVFDGHISDNETPFFSNGIAELRPSQYSENVWSKRLTYALKEFLPHDLRDKVNYTAEDEPYFGMRQVLKSKIPNESYLLSCYIFKGASDITIKNEPITVTVDDANDEDTTSTSGEECSIENGKQSDAISSSMPSKIGEVLAAMHISLVQKVYKMFLCKLAKAKGKTEVTTHGLYINKSLGSYVCTLTIPIIQVQVEQNQQDFMKISVEDLTLGHMGKEQLCFSLEKMLRRSMHLVP